MITDLALYRHIFLTVLGAGSLRPDSQYGWVRLRALFWIVDGLLLVSPHGHRQEGSSLDSSYEGTNPINEGFTS